MNIIPHSFQSKTSLTILSKAVVASAIVVVLLASCGKAEPAVMPGDAPVFPTPTAILPTTTSLPPTATSVPPTATPLPPTATSVPPTTTPEPTPALILPDPSGAYSQESATPELGDTRTRLADEAVMVYVPGGEFKMGSNTDQVDYAVQICKEYSPDEITRGTCLKTAFADEKPSHGVTLDGFWLDRLEVTNGQYRRCVEAGACTPPVDSSSYTRDTYYGNSTFDNYPVVWVRQDQAADYCAWAGARLPTEAEWEYAARGPESRLFPWGNTFDGTRLNYCDVNCTLGPNDETFDDGYADTAPVGSYPSGISWCGALDLAGNVREWVADWYGNYPSKRQVNPTGPSSGESRVPRGGCWLDTPDNARSANRGGNSPDYTRHKVGFRCASR